MLVFDQHRDEWIREGHENRWVVIRAPRVVRFSDSLRDGYLAGLREFGTGVPFMVKQVRREDEIAVVQRTARPRS